MQLACSVMRSEVNKKLERAGDIRTVDEKLGLGAPRRVTPLIRAEAGGHYRGWCIWLRKVTAISHALVLASDIQLKHGRERNM
jgi:hypothetical protein